MLHTIVQIVAFQALFLLVYDLLLKRETFFNYNRAYLLVTSLLSLVLPFLNFSKLKRIIKNDIVIQLPEVFIGIKAPTAYEIQVAKQAGIVLEQPQTPIWQIIIIYGVVIASLIFVFKISKLYWLRSRNPKRWEGNVLLVKLIESSVAFSFFNTIFLGEKIAESKKKTIYKHELIHVKEYHTLDLIFFEVLRIVLWFNPLIYMYQKRIKELHEFIADAKAVKQNGKVDYYQSLLYQVFDVQNISFTNTFFKKSLIKKRIIMLQKSKSKQTNLIKYTLLIPVVSVMLFYISCAKEIIKNDTVDLKQYSYTLNIGEKLEGDKKEIHNKYEEFLKLNSDYVSWAEINQDTNEVYYSVHHKSELLPEDYVETEISFPDGQYYKSYMNFNYFDEEVDDVDKAVEVQELDPRDYENKFEVPFSVVSESPTPYECADLSSNKERKTCLTSFVNKHIGRNFNTKTGDNLEPGKKRIFVQFKIDTEGYVKDVKARGPSEALEIEAKRVVSLLPQFISGRHNGEKVDVPFSLPIVFQIADIKKDE